MRKLNGDDGAERGSAGRARRHPDFDSLGVAPDRVLDGRRQLGLPTRSLGARFHYLKSVGSTNAALAELARAGEPSGTVVLADEQTEGRGRLGRSWFSPDARGIWASVLLKVDAPAETVAPLGTAAAVAVAEALRAHTGLDVRVKWPNDVVVGGKKLAGLLVESAQTSEEPVEAAVVGIGLNVNLREDELPAGLARSTTSLRMCLGRDVRRLDVLGVVLSALEDCFDQFLREGFGGFRGRWRALSTLLGRRVLIGAAPGAREGSVTDLAPSGALVIGLPDGGTHEVWHGDVTPVLKDERGRDDD